MRRFQFKLEAYLKVKKMREQEKFNELAQITSQIASYEAEIQRGQEQVQKLLLEESVRNQQGQFDLQQTLAYRRYFATLQKRAQIAKRKITELQQEVQKRTAAWQQARLERRAVELVKERQYEEYQLELRRLELQDMDEFNSKKYKLTIGEQLYG